MRIIAVIALLLTSLSSACGRREASPGAPAEPPWLAPVKAMIADGDYRHCLRELEDQAGRVPPPPGVEQAWYLQGYVHAYGLSDFRRARPPLQRLVEKDPKHPLAAKALRLTADCYYFDGLYAPASRAYRQLLESYGDAGYSAYALFQSGNCHLQAGRPGDALTAWREAAEKHPQDPFGLKAQISIAGMYVSLDDPQMAKPELERLISMTRDPGLAEAVKDAMKRMDSMKRTSSGKDPG